MNVDWTEAASNDLRGIQAHLSRQSPGSALGVIGRIVDRADGLPKFPRLGPVVAEYADEDLREVFEDPYRIVYRLREDRIEVVAVVHSARRMPRGL